MIGNNQLARALSEISARPHEQRRHYRANISLPGRYMLESKREFPCQTINISLGGMLIAGPVKGGIGERVIFYFEDIGRLEGLVIRNTPDNFAVTMTLAPTKRERLADLLTWLLNRNALGMPEDRRHQRIIPHEKAVEIATISGRRIQAEIVDVSLSGVGLTTDCVLGLGARVEVGRRTGKVVRLFEGGLAIEFHRQIPVDEFDEEIIL